MQVDRAGRTHSLSVLAAANSNIHVFDQPSMFLNALFLPYRERHSELKAAVDAANALSSGGHTFHTVFCHADIVRHLAKHWTNLHEYRTADCMPMRRVRGSNLLLFVLTNLAFVLAHEWMIAQACASFPMDRG